jgi:ankyrin repeat protein
MVGGGRWVMQLSRLPFDASLVEYETQARELHDGWRHHDGDAIRLVRQQHPKFLREDVPWLPKDLSDEEVRAVSVDEDDARQAVARWYDFRSWPSLVEYVNDVTVPGSAVYRFESAVEAVVDGDLRTLATLLRDFPDLVRARSTRITHFDPPRHRATLLHYVAANGVEGYRQRTPRHAVAVATLLLEAGAEVDAFADLYGGECTTMSLLVSSCHPANAGLQVALVDTLLDFGAAVESRGSGSWTSPLMTALAFGYRDAAEALLRRGARVDTLAAAAGLGRLDDTRRLLPDASSHDRHRALALAAQLGQVEIVRLLLEAGEDPNRYNPQGNHGHSTPLHQAALAGHEAVVRLLVERGARLDIRDTIYNGTALGWALHADRAQIAEYLREHGSPAADS